MFLPIGPKEKWEADLQKMSRAALVEVVVEMQWRLALHYGGFGQECMAEILERCKKYGRWANQAARHQRFIDNPDKVIDQEIRRLQARKKAARRNKRRTV
jgi:hypothetical protein